MDYIFKPEAMVSSLKALEMDLFLNEFQGIALSLLLLLDMLILFHWLLQQPGLISRVTDTVKSIVPSWLQKYFKNGDVPEGDTSAVGLDRNNVAPPPNGNDEAPPLPDGQDSPEPSTSNTGMMSCCCPADDLKT